MIDWNRYYLFASTLKTKITLKQILKSDSNDVKRLAKAKRIHRIISIIHI